MWRLPSFFFLAAELCAQTAAPGLHFDVASVRQNKRGDCRGRWDFRHSQGRVIAENAPLRRIISRAFNLTDDRVSGPDWLDSTCYDIQAKAPGAVPDPDLMQMLQSLLTERFQMVAHRDSAARPVLALTTDKGGSKLRPYGDGVPVPTLTDGRIVFMVRHMPDLCERIGKVMGRPVIDKTGLTGDYAIVLAYFPFGAPDAETDILTALRDQLGLKVEPQRAPLEILKIEAIEKVPTAN